MPYFCPIYENINISNVKNHYLKRMFDLMLTDDNPLLLAVIHQNVNQVEEHINTNTKDKGGRTPLHILCSYRQICKGLLQIVLQKNDILEKDELFGWNCIDYAIKAENFLAIEKFLEIKEPSYFDDVFKYKNIEVLAVKFGYPFLLTACINRNPVIIKSRTDPLLHVAVASKNDNVATIINILTRQDQGVDINVKDRRKRTALHLVLEEGDCVLAKLLIDKGADVNLVGIQRKNLLHHAVSTKNSNVEVIELLVDKGIDINAVDLDGATALHLACKQGNLDNVKVLVEKGILINTPTCYKKTALHYAVSSEHASSEIVNFLIDNAIDVNFADSRGVTALHLASEIGHNVIVEILCLHPDININLASNSGRNAMHYAANIEVIRLLRAGLDYNAEDNNGTTILHLASEKGNFDVVCFLLENDASVNMKDYQQRTALHYTASTENPNIELILHLVRHGNDINAKDTDGIAALHLAAEMGHDDIVEILVENGVEVNSVTKNQLSALHYSKSPEVSSFLIIHGADINLSDLNGATPLHLACQQRNSELMELLIENQAKIHEVTSTQRNALHYAASTPARNTEVINFLLEKGVKIQDDRDGVTPLHLASRYNNSYNVEALLNGEASVNAVTDKKENALHFAASNKLPNVEMLKLLIRKGVDVNLENLDKVTPMMMATKCGNGYVEALLKQEQS